MQDTTKQAWAFTKKLKSLSSRHLSLRMASWGWSTLYFKSENDEFLKTAELDAYAYGKDAFSFCSQKNRAICIRSGKSEKDTTFLLLHEIGHILLGHKLDGISLDDEQEANRFADQCIWFSHFSWVKLLTVPGIAIAIFSFGFFTGMQRQDSVIRTQYTLPATASSVVVVTSSGTKYHLPDCRYAAEKIDTRSIPADQAEREGYSPCKTCQPNK